MTGARLALGLWTCAVLSAAGCPPAATLPTGCGKDTDCKGERICVARACVEPRESVPVADRADLGVGGSTDASPVGDAGADAATRSSAPSFVAPGPSAMFHGGALHQGRTAVAIPLSKPATLEHLAAGGVVIGAPAVTGEGLVVFGSHDRSVYAVDPRAPEGGLVRWKIETRDLVWCSPALGPDGLVLVGSDDDNLYAIDAVSGAVRWKLTAGPCRASIGTGPEAARCDVDGVTVGPDGTIYASADGLYAISASGELRWRFSPGRVHCATSPAVAQDGTVLVGCQDDTLYAVDPLGAKRWEFRARDDIDSSPAIGDDGTIYFGSDDRKLYALNPDGTLKFAVVTGGPVRSSPAVGRDGTIYVGSYDGNLYAIRSTGVVAWMYRAADRVAGSPVVDAAGTVLFGAQDDRLYALSSEGKLLWSVLLDGDVDGTPVVDTDGTIYIGADDKALHYLR